MYNNTVKMLGARRRDSQVYDDLGRMTGTATRTMKRRDQRDWQQQARTLVGVAR